ncbi:MAG: S-methyl-5-thioribose-1-phosphate isomerase [Pseudomonadota bacterium]
MAFRTIDWIDGPGALRLLDQRRLPGQVVYLDLETPDAVAGAISDMAVRGAPAIGVAAAYGMVLAARRGLDLAAADAALRLSRPTAVNLAWALDRMRAVWQADPSVAAMTAEARAIEAEDIAVNRAISAHAMTVVPQGRAVFFHHCNTGSLATVDLGTALGIIRTAHDSGRDVMAYLDETRPRLQGAKLSAFELLHHGIPHAIVVDGASAHIMRTRQVDLCVVGCDRVAANGDVANKIGTYNLALAAADNGVPFYVAAPISTIDMATPTGDAIEIEERDPAEILVLDGTPIAPPGAMALNPAFDVTPARLITGIITEKGILRAPYRDTLASLFDADAGAVAD